MSNLALVKQEVPRKERGFGGYVYVLKVGNKVKIGRSQDPFTRIKAISTQIGEIIESIHVTESCYNFEKIEIGMHEKFKKNRIQGEWFNADFDDVVDSLNNFNFEKITDDEDKKRKEKHQKGLEEFRAFLNYAFLTDHSSVTENQYHCKYCQCPIEHYTGKSLETYDGDECKLYSYFFDVMWELEEKKVDFTLDDVRNNCKIAFTEFQDITDFEATINELMDIFDDLGATPSNYVSIKQIGA
jgi:hypothetical protein